jgi:hypothetical protein
MADPLPPGEQLPLLRLSHYAEMTVGNTGLQRTAEIGWGSAGIHVKRFFTGVASTSAGAAALEI